MVIGNSRIRNGYNIALESVLVVYKNPILLVYFLAFTVVNIIVGSILHSQQLLGIQNNYFTEKFFTVSLYVIQFIIGCCLARHTMHILRQQSAGMYESCIWVTHHFKQISLWIILTTVFFFLLPSLFRVVHVLGALLLAVILFFIMLFSTFIIPIITTETISMIPALKRSFHILWNNIGTYLAFIFFLVIFEFILFVSLFLLASLFFSSTSHLYDKSITGTVSIFVSIIANTIFYYEFYIKRELELQEIFFTTQV